MQKKTSNQNTNHTNKADTKHKSESTRSYWQLVQSQLQQIKKIMYLNT